MFIENDTSLYRKERVETSPKDLRYNLLNIRLLKKLLLWRGFPYTLQSLILIILIGLIIIGLKTNTPEGEDSDLLSNLSLVCLLIWGFWWPLMIWTVVLFGRVWCMICPLEFVSRIGEKAGQFLKIKQFKLHGTIKSGFIIVILYALIQLLVAGTGLDDVPAYTAYFLSGLLIFAVLIGLMFKNSAFCKAFCPIAMMLNTYSRGSMLAVRAKSMDACLTCKDKSCVKQTGRGVFDIKSCPGNVFPPKVKSNKDCILCGQCIKSCHSENMKLLIRSPFDRIDTREKTASRIVSAFIMIDSGFVTGELSEQWSLAQNIFMAVPDFISNVFHLQFLSGWIEGLWTLFVFPVLMWTLFGLVLKLIKHAGSMTSLWRTYALRAVVIFSSGHLIKSLIRLSESVKFLPYAVSDPYGVKNVKAFSSGVLLLPQPLVNYAVVMVISFIVLGFAFYFAIRESIREMV